MSEAKDFSPLFETKHMTKRGQRTADALLTAADETFKEFGYDKTTTAEISRRAEVSEGTLFLHYKSKEGLMQALMVSFYRELFEEGYELSLRDIEPLERLHGMLTHYIVKLEANWPTIKIFASHGRIGNAKSMKMFHDLNKCYTDLYIKILETLQEQGDLKPNINPITIREAVFGAIEHFGISKFIPNRRVDILSFLDELWILVFEGALVDKSRHGVYLEQINSKLDHLLDTDKQ